MAVLDADKTLAPVDSWSFVLEDRANGRCGTEGRVIGLDEYLISDVQGYDTSGFRLRDEDKALIVPLMRGDKPMVLGVNGVFPGCRFVMYPRRGKSSGSTSTIRTL